MPEWELGIVGPYFLICLASIALTRNASGASSVALSTIDLLEVAVTLYLFKFVARLSFPNITFAAGVRMLVLLGIGIPALVSLFGGAVVNLTFGAPYSEAGRAGADAIRGVTRAWARGLARRVFG